MTYFVLGRSLPAVVCITDDISNMLLHRLWHVPLHRNDLDGCSPGLLSLVSFDVLCHLYQFVRVLFPSNDLVLSKRLLCVYWFVAVESAPPLPKNTYRPEQNVYLNILLWLELCSLLAVLVLHPSVLGVQQGLLSVPPVAHCCKLGYKACQMCHVCVCGTADSPFHRVRTVSFY